MITQTIVPAAVSRGATKAFPVRLHGPCMVCSVGVFGVLAL
jgi:hypothetical protein